MKLSTNLLKCLPGSSQISRTLWVRCSDLKRSIDELLHVMTDSDFSSISAILSNDGRLVRHIL